MLRQLFTLISAVGTLTLFVGASAQDKPLDDGGMVQGVASCAGSTCHSRQIATGPVVRQNEIVTWQSPTRSSGAHSRAYAQLLTPQGQAISRLAGFGPAENALECLSCHAHDVPEARHGTAFRMSEGVTCEACHGSAEGWLSTHYNAGATHADNIARGLYPTDDVEKRAGLCLDCHFGSDRADQFVTHRIMGAGHPRMSFELELFTALQQHHTVDTDYLERKTHTGSVKAWAVGQAMAMERTAGLFADPQIGTDGLFPELYFFDCHACHQPIPQDRKAFAQWRPNPGRPLGPGTPVFADANLIMLKAAIAEVAPNRAAELDQVGARLHAATRSGRPAAADAASALARYSMGLKADFQRSEFDRATTLAILDRILDSALGRQYTNYAAGEQAVIAVDVFLNALVAEGQLDPSVIDRLEGNIDRAFAAVQSPNDYDPAALRQALSAIAVQVRRL